MRKSFRAQLALRVTAAMAIGLVGISAITLLALRSILDAEIDASILNVASIQAASLTDAPSGEMHFHEWDLTPDEAASVRELVRYAQVWQVDGTSLLRSRFMTSDLPSDQRRLARAGEGELVWAEDVWDGRVIRSLFYPLRRLGSPHERHVLQVAAPLAGRNEMLARVAGFLIVLSVGIALATFSGGWWLAGRAVRPVHEIIDQAEEIGVASLDRRIDAYADTHEYRGLVDVLNTMLGRIQAAFETQRRFTADASHELRSPLTAMRGELELALRRDRPLEEYRRVVESTLEEVVRLSRIIEELLTLARSDSGALQARRRDADVGELAEGVVARLEGQASEKGVQLRSRRAANTVAPVDPGLVSQVAWNLVDNALKFTPAGGRVDVRVHGDGEWVVLEVDDTGPGFGSGDPQRIFDRFYRADEARSHDRDSYGTGLGLAIVKAVADAHGGRVSASNRPGGGGRVAVWLPIQPSGRSE